MGNVLITIRSSFSKGGYINMPTKKPLNQTMDVNGLSIQDILEMNQNDLNRLSRNDLARVTSRLVSASNKRIRSLEKSETGSKSLILKALNEKGINKFSVRNKGHNELLKTLADSRDFLKAKTSTVRGTRIVLKRRKEIIESRTGFKVTDNDVNRVYDALHKAQEMGIIGGRGSKGSLNAEKELWNVVDKNSVTNVDELIQTLESKITEVYEQMIPDEDEFDEDDEYEDDEFFTNRKI